MADQAEVSKLVEGVGIGPLADRAVTSKLVMYVLAVPSDAGDDSNRQGHVYSRIIRRT